VEVFADFGVDAVCPDEDGRRLDGGIVEGEGDDFGGSETMCENLRW
jgi:hypothetical protein